MEKKHTLAEYGYLIVDDEFFQPTENQGRIKQICIPGSIYSKIVKDSRKSFIQRVKEIGNDKIRPLEDCEFLGLCDAEFIEGVKFMIKTLDEEAGDLK